MFLLIALKFCALCEEIGRPTTQSVSSGQLLQKNPKNRWGSVFTPARAIGTLDALKRNLYTNVRRISFFTIIFLVLGHKRS